ncbi:NADH-quinone oxidoreductase subunit NuoN [Pseudalkalibacillus salsuginis]|uniref:NADH-quinone oxidoreductase subunit NuoN n=1 Tax=Pseudalkalibacillus salsuginis TaxID=2910972 RepID=UPI001F36AA6D|nr:NADH-quinone oxidoreductase subunit NuoN [Pseudalkalibacillus salsuginis]MCF6410950.1 NADH-quinone oxidoreductase subunit NuoN [Pseudalkalibacillus salsuginis]
MTLEKLLSYDWGIMAPEFTILIVATLLSLMDLFMPNKTSRKPLALLGIAGVIIAIVFSVLQIGTEPTSILFDTYRFDAFALAFKLLFLVATGLILLLAIDYEGEREWEFRGEFFYLLLTALLGAMMMASSADLITLFVGLELLSISSYILAGIRKNNLHSNEAAFKYVVNGGIATAITLFGMSYIYGLTGSTNLYEISEALTNPAVEQNAFLLVMAFVMLLVGLAFKIAAAPFHMWAPDVYQGSATPVTAFLSVVSKSAGFALILKMFLITFLSVQGWHNAIILELQPYIAVIAGVTMVVGNVVALRQRNIKRMFAYSSIAHAGYVLVPFVSLSLLVFKMTWFYLLAYLLMNIGAFAVIQFVTEKERSEDFTAFSGLYKRAPWVAVMMAVFILSLAGLPFTAGFIGKFGIFMSSLGTGHYVLASVMIATTVISYVYYFNILVQIFFRKGEVDRLLPSIGLLIVMIICGAGTIFFGIYPGAAYDFFQEFDMNELFIK